VRNQADIKEVCCTSSSKASTSRQEWGLSQKKQEKDVRYIHKASSGRAFNEKEVMVEADVDVDVYMWVNPA